MDWLRTVFLFVYSIKLTVLVVMREDLNLLGGSIFLNQLDFLDIFTRRENAALG